VATFAIIAGGGRLPLLIADSAKARGDNVHIVAIRGEADIAVTAFPHTWVGWGQIGRMIKAVRRGGNTRLVIAGHVTRPDLMTLRPDFGWIRNLPAIARLVSAGGDNAVLTRVIAFFEAQGLTVLPVHEVAPELLARRSALDLLAPTVDVSDRNLAYSVLSRLAHLDVGQAIVAAGGRVVAIEGVDGTDRMLARIAQFNPSSNWKSNGVLVKAPKAGQELRIDMPTIGPNTITGAAAAGIAMISVADGEVLLLDRDIVEARARELGVHLDVNAFSAPPLGTATARRLRNDVQQLGRIGPSRADLEDVAIGLDVVTGLAPFNAGGATAVVRQHVLAVGANETHAALAERVADLRQWGSRRLRAARGALIVRIETSADIDRLEALVVHLVRARLGGLGIVDLRDDRCPLPANLVAAVDHAGLFIVEATQQ
jgi:UDP-2,3-diacylglucosamine hydrolase